MTRNRRQKDSSGSKREGLQDGDETCYQVRFGDSGTKKKAEGRAGGGC